MSGNNNNNNNYNPNKQRNASYSASSSDPLTPLQQQNSRILLSNESIINHNNILYYNSQYNRRIRLLNILNQALEIANDIELHEEENDQYRVAFGIANINNKHDKENNFLQ